MSKNKRSVIEWIKNNHKSGYDSRPISIYWPLTKRAELQKKTRKRGMNAITTDQILPTKKRYSVPNENLDSKCKRQDATIKKLLSKNRKLLQLLKENNIDVSDEDYTDNEDQFEPRTDSRVEACDTEYLNRHKFILMAQNHGAMKRASVDLIKHSLMLQLDGNFNAQQVDFMFKHCVNKLGLFPHGDGYTAEFFRSHREICSYINEYVIAEKLKEGSRFFLYFDGSPSGKGKNLLSFGLFDENCESWNLGIDQFEYFRSSGVPKAVAEGNFIMERIRNICDRHNLDYEEIAKKIIGLISDNAPAAEATRKYLIRKLDEIAPLEQKRKSLGCSVHWVSLRKILFQILNFKFRLLC